LLPWRNLLLHLYWGAVFLFALGALAIGISLFYLRRSRVARYYIMREEARRKGLRWLTAGVVTFLLGGGLLYIWLRPPGELLIVTQLPSPVTPTDIAGVGSPLPVTPLPTAVPSPTPTRRPTATPPFIPTPTPAYALPETALSPLPEAVPANPEAQISFITFAQDQENGQPVGAGSEFPAGDSRVYFFFEYEGMNKGAVWTYAWYQDGEYLDGNTCPWGSGTEGCPQIFGRNGRNFLFYKPPGGYDPGLYTVRIWIEDRLQTEAQFVVQPFPEG